MKKKLRKVRDSLFNEFICFNSRYFYFLRNTKLHMRLIISFLLISIIPALIIGMISYRTATNSVKNKISTFSEQLMNQLKKNMQVELDKYSYLCDQLSVSDVIQTNLKNYRSSSDNKRYSYAIQINNILGEKALFYNYINDLQINTVNGDVFYDRGYGSILITDIKRITEHINQTDGNDFWTYGNSVSGAKCLVLGRRMTSIDNYSVPLGYTYASVDESVFAKNTYKSVNMGKGTDVFVIDQEGTVVSSVNPKIMIGSHYGNTGFMQKLKSNSTRQINAYRDKIDGRNELVVYDYLENNKWFIVSTIPFSYINSETQNIRIIIIVVCTLCILFSLFLSLIIAVSILIPLKKIVGLTGQVIDGNLDIRIEDTGEDEMGFLSAKLNNMVDKIKELLHQVEQEQRGKREKELEVLQAQINPHFLFNTLNSLKWTAMMSRVNVISDGIGALAELLRNTIIDSNAMISVREELKNIQNYIIIQKIRYGESFELVYNCEEQVMEYMILKFLLQPIVENSIIHGIEEEAHKLTIVIDIAIEAVADSSSGTGCLRINISDNGKGFDVSDYQRSDQLPKGSSNRLSHIGLSNVMERIHLNFGQDYKLSITSSPGKGTITTILLPLIEPERLATE